VRILEEGGPPPTDPADPADPADPTDPVDPEGASGDDTAEGEVAGAVGPAEHSDPGRSMRWITRAAIALGVLPVLVAGVRAAVGGWTPTGDDAYSAVRAHDVFSSNAPLLGTWSSASIYTGHQINHPGALHFDLLAIPVHLLGHGPGTAVGMALVNAAAVGSIGWLMARRLGAPGAALAMACATLLTWSMGSEMLYDPWSQHAPLLPFALFLVAVWCAIAGDRVALPIMVVAGTYALQTHLSYAMLVPGLAVLAVTCVVVSARGQRRRDRAAWVQERRRTLGWLAAAVVTLVAVSVQPMIEQLTADGEGNITALVRSRHAEAPTPTLGDGVRALGGTVVLPPAWLAPSYGSPSFHFDGTGRPTWLAITGLVGLTALLVVLGFRAWRRGSSTVTAGAATAGAALAIGLVTIDRAPMRWGMAPTYLRWMWPLGMLVWLVVAVAVLDEVTARRRTRTPAGTDPTGASSEVGETDASHAVVTGTDPGGENENEASRATAAGALSAPRRVAAGVGLVVTAMAAVATLPTVDNGAASPPWTVEAIDEIDDDVVAAVEDEPGVLVEMTGHIAVGATAPALFGSLQEAGVPFYVDEVALVRQLGDDRAYQPGDATVRLTIRGGRSAEAAPGERLVAEAAPRANTHIREPGREDRVVKVYLSRLSPRS
jgi:hypothetical protein